MNAQSSTRLLSLLKRLRSRWPQTLPATPVNSRTPTDGYDDLLHELVYSMLLCEDTSAHASRAYSRIREAFADLNELRVSVESDVIEALADSRACTTQQAQRTCSALRDIHARFDALTLEPLRAMSTRDALAQLHAIHGVTPFAASRCALVCLQAPTVPVDMRLRDNLARARIIPATTKCEDLSRAIAQLVPRGDHAITHALLQQFSDAGGVINDAPRRAAARSRPRARRAPSKQRTEGEQSP